MNVSIEIRLINLAQKVVDMYSDKITKELYQQLRDAINVCKDYHTKGQGDLWDMYEVVLGEDGIWNYGYSSKFEEEIQCMWALETDILSCNCYLGCVKERADRPQDLELQGDNIPEFVELLENVISDEIDYDKIFDFWGEKMCY